MVMVGMKLDFTNSDQQDMVENPPHGWSWLVTKHGVTNSDQPSGGLIFRSRWSWLVQNVFSPTMTNHAVQNIHFQLVLVDHKNVILGFDVTTVPTSTNGAVAVSNLTVGIGWYTRVTVPTSTNGEVAPNSNLTVGDGWSIYPLPALR